MEITIKAQCPNCREDIIFSHETKGETFKKNKQIEDSFFELTKNATLKLYKRDSSFDDLYKIIDKDCLEASNVSKAVKFVQNYFKNLEFKINIANDPRELLKISRNLVKTKAVVRKDVQKEINKQKKKVLKAIKKRVKELKKKRRK